ncbi:MAG: potassium channel protein, partial [Aigarchaeota archaeon]|nr:potassium channel protein [Aigarchaeota archaeon]
MERFRYQPIGVRKALTEMKDLSELMVDLAYSAVLFNDREIAEEVRELESRVEDLRYILGMNAMISVRDAQDAELMAPITMAASAANKISDAAADIANIVLLNLGLHPAVLKAFQEVDERVARVRVFEESVLVGKTLAKLRLPIKFG